MPNNENGVDFATDFCYYVSCSHGGVAQLGECLNGIQEVVGSIPIVSTRKKNRKPRLWFPVLFCFATK